MDQHLCAASLREAASSLAITESPLDVNDLLNEQEEEYRWLIPGLLEEGDRVLLTGGEGKGKSTLLRQMAVQLALGIHPFTQESIQPRRVMLVDLENGRRSVRRKLKELIKDRVIPKGQLHIATWSSGLDLSYPGNQVALAEILSKFWPELLIIGPMYKMGPHLEQEVDSATLAFKLDEWRAMLGFSLIMEAHQPHQMIADGKKYRPERPFGSSLWLRWPEFGICLEDNGTLRHWRGPREERDWPDKLVWGEEWPWEIDKYAGLCAHCILEPARKNSKYCSDKCAAAMRKSNQRARDRLI